MGGLVAPKIFAELPCTTIPMCMEIDGRFPNHEANPLIEENRAHIVERVVKEKADIGIAWDGDADRCFFIDGTGEFVSGDFITALLAEAFLMKYPGSTIVYDLRASYAVKDTCARLGGTAIMNRVGHSFIKKTMRERDAIFGGEVTGHYYFRDNFYADNRFIPAVLLLELRSKKGQPLAELLAPPLKARRAFYLGRDQHEGRQHGRREQEARRPQREIRGRDPRAHRRRLGRLPGLALQRTPVEYGAAAASES